jgi:stress response protein YsnF
MDGNNEEKKNVGRPRTNDPKIKIDSVRLKTSTIIDIEVIAEQLGISKSVFVQTILENEMEIYKNLLKL